MAIEDSTMTTGVVQDNEIVKAADFNYSFESVIKNVSKVTQMLLEATQDFVINGVVKPYSGMNLIVSPIYGVCFSTGTAFGRTEETQLTEGFIKSTQGRVDILEVRGDYVEFDSQQRAFNDPDTDTKTYQYVNTKEYLGPSFKIKQGTEGSSVAPATDTGYVKLCEVVIRANADEILESDILNITSDVEGLANSAWTNESSKTYNIGYISDVNARFRKEHNKDGSHGSKVIKAENIDIGTNSTQLGGQNVPVGAATKLAETDYAATESLATLVSQICTQVTNLYTNYLKNGAFNFNGELSLSDLVTSNVLTKALKIKNDGAGTATVSLDGKTILTMTNNKLVVGDDYSITTTGKDVSNTKQIVTMAVTNAIWDEISSINEDIKDLQGKLTDLYSYINGTLGRYSIDTTTIACASTANISSLAGLQTIDSYTLVANDIILVKNQTDQTQNGLYQVSSSAWVRYTGYATPTSIKYKIWSISKGGQAGKMFYCPSENFSTTAFGTDNIEFTEYMGSISNLGLKTVVRNSNGDINVGKVNGIALQSAAGKVAGSAAGNVPLVGTALNTSVNGNVVVANTDGSLKPSGYTIAKSVPSDAKFSDTTYTAGTNVSISSSNVISATNTTYTAGDNVSISADNKISATDTTYTAGDNVSISADNKISATNTTYTAGTNVSISSSNVISATDTNTTYSFATGSTNGAFSVTPSGGSASSVSVCGLNSAAYCSTQTRASQSDTNVLTNKYVTGIANGAVCSTGAGTDTKVVTIPGFTLFTGAVVRVLFTNACTIAGPSLNVSYDGTNYTGAKKIVGICAGDYTRSSVAVPTLRGHYGYWRQISFSSSTFEVWQKNTFLELMYDGTYWVILGNPTLESYYTDSLGYEVKADGKIEQWFTFTINGTQSHTFPVQFTDTNYNMQLSYNRDSSDTSPGGCVSFFGGRSTSGIKTCVCISTSYVNDCKGYCKFVGY